MMESRSINNVLNVTTIANLEGKPVGNLFFAGEHASSFYEWQGFMEGSATSGITAAQQLLAFLRGRS
jgi:monoamine oxidase